jgi:hypothetical protein
MYNSKDKFVVYSTVCTMSIFIALSPHPSANLRLVYLQRILRKFEKEKHYVVFTERIVGRQGSPPSLGPLLRLSRIKYF